MATLIKGIKSIYEGIVSLIYPNSCPFEITHECSMKDYCSPEGWNDKVCHFCINEFVDLNLTPRIEENGVLIHSVAEYKNEVKTIIQKFKWSIPALALPIAELMKYKINNSSLKDQKFDYIVPVPGLISEDRNWTPSLLLAQELSELLNIKINEPLEKITETNAHRLDKVGRTEATKKAYTLKEDISQFQKQEQRILLIDDLIASGNTIDVCSDLLLSLNPNNIITAITFAVVSPS